MRPNQLVNEINALGFRIESGSLAIGDFMRTKIKVRLPDADRDRVLPMSGEVFDAMLKLVEKLSFGYAPDNPGYAILMHQAALLFYGVATGQIKSNFIARIGV